MNLESMLNEDERLILGSVLEGIVKGREVYGPLEVNKDKREFLLETLEEIRDALVYVGARIIQVRRLNGTADKEF